MDDMSSAFVQRSYLTWDGETTGQWSDSMHQCNSSMLASPNAVERPSLQTNGTSSPLRAPQLAVAVPLHSHLSCAVPGITLKGLLALALHEYCP